MTIQQACITQSVFSGRFSEPSKPIVRKSAKYVFLKARFYCFPLSNCQDQQRVAPILHPQLDKIWAKPLEWIIMKSWWQKTDDSWYSDWQICNILLVLRARRLFIIILYVTWCLWPQIENVQKISCLGIGVNCSQDYGTIYVDVHCTHAHLNNLYFHPHCKTLFITAVCWTLRDFGLSSHFGMSQQKKRWCK